MAIYAMCLLDQRTIVKQSAAVLVAFVAVVVMTAFYWVRWMPELAWITHNSAKYFSTTWDYRANFLLVPSHWTNLSEDVLNLWFADLMLVVAVVVAIPAVVVCLRDKSTRKALVPLIVVASIAVLMTTPLSTPLWDELGFLQKLQFPWRWLAVASVLVSVLGAVGITRGLDTSKDRRIFVPGIIALSLAALAFMTVLIIRTPVYIAHSQLDAEIATFDDSTGCDCWWPVWARVEALGQKEEVVADGRYVTINSWSPRERSFVVGRGDVNAAVIKVWYYPHWQANVNGVAVPTRPDENGALSVDIPPGEADVKLRFVEPQYVPIASVISLVAWIVILFGGMALLLKSRGTKTLASGRRSDA
jgi:hypothetical protein